MVEPRVLAGNRASMKYRRLDSYPPCPCSGGAHRSDTLIPAAFENTSPEVPPAFGEYLALGHASRPSQQCLERVVVLADVDTNAPEASHQRQRIKAMLIDRGLVDLQVGELRASTGGGCIRWSAVSFPSAADVAVATAAPTPADQDSRLSCPAGPKYAGSRLGKRTPAQHHSAHSHRNSRIRAARTERAWRARSHRQFRDRARTRNARSQR